MQSTVILSLQRSISPPITGSSWDNSPRSCSFSELPLDLLRTGPNCAKRQFGFCFRLADTPTKQRQFVCFRPFVVDKGRVCRVNHAHQLFNRIPECANTRARYFFFSSPGHNDHSFRLGERRIPHPRAESWQWPKLRADRMVLNCPHPSLSLHNPGALCRIARFKLPFSSMIDHSLPTCPPSCSQAAVISSSLESRS